MPAGTYLVGGGIPADQSFGRLSHQVPLLTYYPGTTEEAEAKPIEIKPGREATDIDIRLAGNLHSHDVTVQVVEARTRQPVSGVDVVFERLQQEKATGRSTGADLTTDANGRVLFNGLLPGRYAAYLEKRSTDANETGSYYSEPTYFEVKDSDLDYVVVEALRGAVISGRASTSKQDAPIPMTSLAGATLLLRKLNEHDNTPSGSSYAAFDGSGAFRFAGLRAGRYRLEGSFDTKARGWVFWRAELKGVPLNSFFELQAGQQLTDLRAVFVPAQGVIRGQVQFNAPVPAGLVVYVEARWLTGGAKVGTAAVDERKQFRLEKLPAGDYELSIGLTPDIVNGKPAIPIPPAHQSPKIRTTLTGEGEVNVTLTVEFTQTGGRQ